MASFTKRGNTWQYTVSRMVDGKYKPIRKGGFRTKKEATLAAAKVESDITDQAFEKQLKGNDIALAQYFLEWYGTYKQDINQTTLRAYAASYSKILDHFGDKPIQNITKRDYQNFMNEVGKTHSRATNKKLNGYVRSCVKEAIDEDLIKIDFTRKATISGTVAMKSSDKFLDLDCSKKLLDYLYEDVDNISNAMMIVALATGLRYGELVGMCVEDIDFENKWIKVRRQWDYIDGGFKELKSEASERTVSVDSKTLEVLQRRKEVAKNEKWNEHGLIFYNSEYNASVMTNFRLNNNLRDILQKLKIKPVITAHGLRHTHSSILLYKGISILYVSERLGHSNIDITTTTYAHVLKELRERDSVRTGSIFENL